MVEMASDIQKTHLSFILSYMLLESVSHPPKLKTKQNTKTEDMDSENWVWDQSNSKNGLRKFYSMYTACHNSNNVQSRE